MRSVPHAPFAALPNTPAPVKSKRRSQVDAPASAGSRSPGPCRTSKAAQLMPSGQTIGGVGVGVGVGLGLGVGVGTAHARDGRVAHTTPASLRLKTSKRAQ